VRIFEHPFEYRNALLRLSQHLTSDTATPLIKKVKRGHYLFICCTHIEQITWFSKNFAELTKLIKRTRYLQVWPETSDIWRWLSDLKWELFEAFSEVEILMFFDKRTLSISLLILFSLLISLAYLFFLALARRKNIKIWTFGKASKSSHFRSDNQRQISLVSNHACRYRMRLIS
jgi:hypothetical protein